MRFDLARGYTGRNIILKFEGCYHGASDSLLIKAGSGVATLGLPDSPGVPEGVAKNTLLLPTMILMVLSMRLNNMEKTLQLSSLNLLPEIWVLFHHFLDS